MRLRQSLPVTLSCATGTRQRPKSTRQRPKDTRQTVHDIYSVGKQLFAKCFLLRTRQMVCRVSNFTLGKKKSGLPSVFPKYTRQRIIVCRMFLGITLDKPIFQRKNNNFFLSILLLFAKCFLELHSANLFSKEKIIIFLSAYHYCLPSVFENYTRQTYFPKKKNIFFSAYFSLIAVIQNTLSTPYLHAHHAPGNIILIITTWT